MKFLIVGSSSGLGRALADELAAAGHNLLLIASDARDLQAQSSDLILKTSVEVDYLAIHIEPYAPWSAVLEKKITEAGDLDGLFFPIGWSSDHDAVDCSDAELTDKIVEINFTSITKIVSFCLPKFFLKKQGYIIGFGSIASLRGRSSNVVYSAAKRALASYFESLRHAIAKTNIRAQFYQLGYLDTPRNSGKKLLFTKADPRKAARYIVKNLNNDFGVKFFPRWWFFLQYVIRWTPWQIFKRLDF